MAENKGILPSSTFNTLGNNSNKWEAVYAKKLVGPLTGNVTGNCSGSSGSCTGNAATATKATQDSAGQQINTTYLKGLSISGQTITYTKGNGSTGTITVPTGSGYITESKYNSDGSWYRKYSDGWIEQGGKVTSPISIDATITVSFFKPFKLNYLFLTTWNSNNAYYSHRLSNYSSTSFNLNVHSATQGAPSNPASVIVWYACGMGAE